MRDETRLEQGEHQPSSHLHRSSLPSHRSYFLLHGAQLTYYESEEAAASGAKPKGQALVEAIRHAVPDDAPECDEIMLGATERVSNTV